MYLSFHLERGALGFLLKWALVCQTTKVGEEKVQGSMYTRSITGSEQNAIIQSISIGHCHVLNLKREMK